MKAMNLPTVGEGALTSIHHIYQPELAQDRGLKKTPAPRKFATFGTTTPILAPTPSSLRPILKMPYSSGLVLMRLTTAITKVWM